MKDSRDNTASTAPRPRPAWLAGRKELVMVALLAALGALLLIGSLIMDVQGDSAPGPRFVPVMVGVLVLLLAGALLVDVIRNPEAPHDEGDEHLNGDFSPDMLRDISGLQDPGERADGAEEASEAAGTSTTASDLRTLGLVLLCLIVFVAVLPYAGWVLSAAALFWCVSRLLGSRRPLLDVGIALLTSSVIQLVFGGLLGLSLPALFGGSL